MKFIMQVYYCCWKEVVAEVTKDYRTADVELMFYGNYRRHAADCSVMNAPPKQKSKPATGIDILTAADSDPTKGTKFDL